MRFSFILACVAVVSVACSSQSSGHGIDQINAPTTIAADTSSSALRAMTECKYQGCSAVTANVAAGTRVTSLPSDIHPSLDDASKDQQLPPGLTGDCARQGRKKSPACLVPGPKGSTLKMALFGDSLADIWSGTLSAIAHKAGYSFLLMAEDNCHSPAMTFWDVTTRAPDETCDEWRANAVSRINSFKPQVVLIATQDIQSFNAADKVVTQPEYSAALKKTIRKVSAPNRKIILIGDAPYSANFGPACLAANKSHVQQCTAPADQAVLVDNEAALKATALASGAEYVNVVPWFCTDTLCPQVIDHTVVYLNPGHFTGTYAKELTEVMTTALGLT